MTRGKNPSLSTSHSQLIKDLQEELDAADESMHELLKTGVLPDEMLREYLTNLTLLQNKHVPADVCTEVKLMERLNEVVTWRENLKWDIENGIK